MIRFQLALAMLLPSLSAYAGEGVSSTPVEWASPAPADSQSVQDGSARLWGQLQVWETVMDQDVSVQADPATYGDPEADPGFGLRRARFGFDGLLPLGDRPFFGQIDYALSVGVAAPYDTLTTQSSSVQMVDAFARWTEPESFGTFSIAAGMQKVPFSREALMSSKNLVFQERAVGTNWMSPGRDIGIVTSYTLHFKDPVAGPRIVLGGGIFNGSSSLFGDVDPGALHSARLEFAYGDTYRTWSHDLQPALGAGAAYLTDRDLATTTGSLEADLLARWKFITLQGELISSTITPTESTVAPPAVAAEIARLGWMGQLSIYVPIRASGVEISGRHATYDDSTTLQNSGDVGIIHAGVTWREALPGFDLGGGYIHRIETANVNNDTIRLWMQVRPQIKLL